MKRVSLFHGARRPPSPRKQGGAVAVEFALVALIYFMLLLGIMEFGRWLFTLNAANEATRWGARVAAACGSTPSQIQAHVNIMLRSGNGTLSVTYPDSTCVTTSCMVTVTLVGATFTPLIPFLGGTYDIPNFTTSLPREAMGSAGSPNDGCP